MSSAQSEVLSIPELRFIIADFLPIKDLLSCTLITKDWNHDCTPLVWRKLWIGANIPEKLPKLEHVKKHGHHVRTLLLEDFIGIKEYLPCFSQLHVLKLLAYGDEEDQDSEGSNDANDTDEVDGEDNESNNNNNNKNNSKKPSVLFNLVSQNQSTLKCFENHWMSSSITQQVLCAILSCQNLERLVATSILYQKESLDLLFKVGPQLKAFYSIDNCFEPEDPLDFSSPWSNIRSLSFQFPDLINESKFVIKFVKNCPQIKMFTWDTNLTIPVKVLADQVFPSCPNLDALKIHNSVLEDKDISKIIKAMKHVRHLQFRGSSHIGPGKLTVEVLRSHFLTLESIYFPSTTFKSQYVQEILASCPRLKYIQANRISAKDIREGSPWVCTGLITFCVPIVGVKEEDGNYRAVYRQLSRLKELVELDLCINSTHSLNDRMLKLSLDLDLGELSKMVNLRYISVARTPQEMNEKDIEWIVKHWKGLEVWEGRMNTEDEGINGHLTEMLKNHGVKCRSYYRTEIPRAYSIYST